MTRELFRVRCERKVHTLAIARVDGDHAGVEVRTMVATSRGMKTVPRTFTTEGVETASP